MSRRLVTGGARSGKSKWAEQQFAGIDVVEYVATSSYSDDAEWARRVLAHQQRRPSGWVTTETIDVATVLLSGSEVPVLVDCLSVWLARVLDELGAWAQPAENWRCALLDRVDALVAAVASTQRDVILVTNEVGAGVVPESASGRLYRDELGSLNARVGAEVDEVWFCVAGIAKRWK